MQRKHVLWEDIRRLHGVRSLTRLADSRWHLDVNFSTSDGRLIEGPTSSASGPQRLMREIRARATEKDFLKLSELVANPVWAEPVVLEYQGLGQTVGLKEIAAPVVLENQRLGWVLIGMFISFGDRPDIPAFQALNLDASQSQLALGFLRRLDEGDVELLCDLASAVASEVAAFQAQVAGGERRRDRMPEYQARYGYVDLIGKSSAMQQLYRLLDTVVDSDAPVLIEGENGTGKQLIARAIHQHAHENDSSAPFLVQNCSAFAEPLLDAALFGQSIDGAENGSSGLLGRARGGTLFLDEISGLTPLLQVKLYNALQQCAVQSDAGGSPRDNDDYVRIIAATNQNLQQLVDEGRFREDLYYAINVVHIAAPMLRERREDISMLVEHFLQRSKRPGQPKKQLTPGCMARLVDYEWPGNVRELENEIRRLVVLSGDQQLIGEELLSGRIAAAQTDEFRLVAGDHVSLANAVEDLERNMIRDVLRQHRWNKTRAAEELQISRRNLIRKVHKYDLDQRGSVSPSVR